MLSVMLYTVYGIPSLYSGDEAGLEGYTDPFCRMPYPWGREDSELLDHYRRLGAIRREESVFKKGGFSAFVPDEGVIGYFREDEEDRIIVLASRRTKETSITLDGRYRDLMDGEIHSCSIILKPDTAVVMKRIK